MSKYKTLQECYEEAGSKFPFIVHTSWFSRTFEIIGKAGNKWQDKNGNWYSSTRYATWALVKDQPNLPLENLKCLKNKAEHAVRTPFNAPRTTDVAYGGAKEIKCECGSEACGSSAHSEWCPKHEKI